MPDNQNPELGEKLRSLAGNHYTHINDSIDSGYGLESWFRAYIQSDAFADYHRNLNLTHLILMKA